MTRWERTSKKASRVASSRRSLASPQNVGRQVLRFYALAKEKRVTKSWSEAGRDSEARKRDLNQLRQAITDACGLANKERHIPWKVIEGTLRELGGWPA